MKYLWTLVHFPAGRFCTLRRCAFALFTLIVFADGEAISECNGEKIRLNKTVSISSPDYRGVTSSGRECTWMVESTKGKYLLVKSISLSFGSVIQDECDKGMLEIFDGCDKERFLVEKICNRRAEYDQKEDLWVSSGSCITIKFSPGSGNKYNFLLRVVETEARCGDILPHTNKNQTFVGSLMSTPRGPNKCVWIISVPRGKIELVFKDKFLVTSHGKDCKDDFVQVQDGKFSISPSLGTFCGTARPYPVYSTGQYLRVTLQGSSSGMNLKHSFTAQFNVIDSKPTPQTEAFCTADGIALNPKGGSFRTPRYLDQYPASLHCTWMINADKNHQIVLKFRDFDVEGDSQDCPDDSDFTEVYNGIASWSKIIGRYCGSVIPPAITSDSNKLRIEFHSNTQYAGRGFDAMYSLKAIGEQVDYLGLSYDDSLSMFVSVQHGIFRGQTHRSM